MTGPDIARATLASGAAALVLALAGCNGGSTSGSTVTVQGEVPIAYVQRSTALSLNPTDGTNAAPGGDLMIREKSSPSAPEHNITARFTLGRGDVSDPEVSYDGKRIVFSMTCPVANDVKIGDQPACTGRWNLWEYDMGAGGYTSGTFRRLTASTTDDDVDPAYLPAGRGFVFSSNRQTRSKLDQGLGRAYYALDEYERERVLNLHTMDADGGAITQISFNQSHDRNPVVRENGDIMFSRWEHLADRNRFAVFRVKPDGTDMFVLYGAQSPGNSFLHPREMDPKGRYKGHLTSSLMPLSRTQEGGALMFIDADNYSEQDTPANAAVPARGGQRQLTPLALNDGRGLSKYGRITTPFPLWDGTDRVLFAYRPCAVTRRGVPVLCSTLTPQEFERVANEDRLPSEVAADELQDNAPASYAIYMYDPRKQTQLVVASPPAGYMYTDPIPLQARAEPNATEPTAVDADLAARKLALIEVRSVYDTDGLQRMAEPMLTDADRPAGCAAGIATTAPTDALDTRARVADLKRIKDPADPAYGCTPVRFVRAMRAVPPPASSMNMRAAIGETDFEQQQILGYAPVEPDGSFKLHVPADTPLALAIVDAQGRAFQTHTNWIQVRPGERRTCDGCHSPRRGGSINAGDTVNTQPAALKAAMRGAHRLGETMAALRVRLDPAALALQHDMVSTDIWADTTQAGVTARAPLALRYTGHDDPADDLATPAPANGVINYPEHIQPLWTRNRGAQTCTACHADTAKLDLRATVGGSGRVTSYEELVVGDPRIDPATGRPVTRLEDGVAVIVRGAALVNTSSGAMNTAGIARKSRLTEILFGQTLLAGAEARSTHPNPPSTAPDHATMLNRAEKRLIAEWMDLGGQYYNDPFDANSGVRTVRMLSQATFEQQVFPILRSSCASACHQAVGSDRSTPAGDAFRENRLVLTGSAEGDYGVTLSLVSDTCNPASNPLLRKPSTVPHPAAAAGQTRAVLPAGSAAYQAIAAWIATGCPTP
mgnify:FL=1